jgi:hypothetical protein
MTIADSSAERVEIEESEDEQKGERDDEREPGLGTLVVLELSRPVDPVARGIVTLRATARFASET